MLEPVTRRILSESRDEYGEEPTETLSEEERGAKDKDSSTNSDYEWESQAEDDKDDDEYRPEGGSDCED